MGNHQDYYKHLKQANLKNTIENSFTQTHSLFTHIYYHFVSYVFLYQKVYKHAKVC